MSIIQGSSISASSTESGDFYEYPIEQSLRFDGSSYLSKTFGTPTSQDVLTLSMWVKRSGLATAVNTGHSALFMANNGNYNTLIKFAANSQLPLNAFSADWSNHGTSTSNWRGTQSVFRDTSSWYHLVWNFNSSPFKNELYVNGILDTTYNNLSGYSNPTSTYINNNNLVHTIGRYSIGNTMYFNGYMANIHFVDGQALSASDFGEFVNGIWVPKTYLGTYGTNGFRLAFDSSDFNWSGSSTMTDPYGSATAVPIYGVADASGNGKHWVMNS